jgi:phage terminase small subunit
VKKTKKKLATKSTEREDLELALSGFRDIAKQAAADMAKTGLVIEGSQGRVKTNPSAKLFRDAVKTLASLRKQLAALEKEEATAGKGTGDQGEWKDFD